MRDRQYPLYHEESEHESCGVGAIVDLSGKATHRTVDQALSIVERLAHRAGSDALGTTGDGVGIMTNLPHSLFSVWAQEEGVSLGNPGDYGVGMFFFPEDEVGADNARHIFEQLAASENLSLSDLYNLSAISRQSCLHLSIEILVIRFSHGHHKIMVLMIRRDHA